VSVYVLFAFTYSLFFLVFYPFPSLYRFLIFSPPSFSFSTGHPLREGLLYVDKHDQPSNWRCMEGLMNSTYGSLSAEVMLRQVTALAQTGDQHIAVFDQANDAVYMAVTAAPTATTPAVPAYNRPFLKFKISDLFSEPRPTLD
jgi:hypothetical protein